MEEGMPIQRLRGHWQKSHLITQAIHVLLVVETGSGTEVEHWCNDSLDDI